MKKKLDILYEDKFIIIVNKPSNLLTISTEKEKERTLFHYVFDYLKKYTGEYTTSYDGNSGLKRI